jgi:hypothetical protein
MAGGGGGTRPFAQQLGEQILAGNALRPTGTASQRRPPTLTPPLPVRVRDDLIAGVVAR